MAAAVQLNFKNHCIFCLQPQPPGAITEIILRNEKKIESFEPLLCYLTGIDPTYSKSREVCKEKGIPVMINLPPMCQPCYDLFGELNHVHQLLTRVQISIQKKTEAIRDKIPRRGSARSKFIDRIVAAGMPEAQVSKARDFITNLHEAIINEGKSQVLYPSKLPVSVNDGSETYYNNSTPSSTVPAAASTPRSRKAISKFAKTSSSASKRPKLSPLFESTQHVTPPQHFTASDLVTASKKNKLFVLQQNPVSKLVAMIPSQPQPIIYTGTTNVAKYEDEDSTDPLFMPSNPMEHDIVSTATVKDEPIEQNVPSRAGSSRRKQSLCTLAEPPPSDLKQESKETTQIKKVFDRKTQHCDLCGKLFRIVDIAKHLKTHVKNYVTKCLNPSCRFHFSCPRKMHQHLKTNMKCRTAAGITPPFKMNCYICNHETMGVPFLMDHLLSHENENTEKVLICPIPGCTQAYALKQLMECHIYYHDLRPPKTERNCFLCKSLIHLDKMEEHLKSDHQITDPVRCKHCKFMFPNRESILAHLFRGHRDENGAACDLCNDDKNGIKFRDLRLLRRHYFYVHNIGTITSVECEYCSLDFDSENLLLKHHARWHPDKIPEGQANIQDIRPATTRWKNKIIQCNLCPHGSVGFNSNAKLIDHKIEVHDQDPLKCKQCDKSFRKYKHYRAHIKEHAGIAKPVFKCKVPNCGKVCNAKKSLVMHARIAHSNPNSKIFTCELCGKGFNYRKRLQEHQNFVHFGVRIICELCGEGFSTEKTLACHMRIHTGERPFSCPICNQAFRHTSVLTTHVRSHKERGSSFKPNGPMKHIRKRVNRD